MKRSRRVRFLMFLPFGLAFLALVGWVVMSLWNWLMPALFGLPAIGYWQAWGILILSKILFGAFHGGHGGNWRHRMMERWDRMTPEEREKFRQALDSRLCPVPPPANPHPNA